MANSGFSISIRALDEVTSVAEKIKRELKTVADSQRKETQAGAVFFERISQQVKHTGRGLEEIGKKAKETGRRLGEAFEPITELAGLGGIAAIGSLAGITAALERYATTGERLGHTSKLLGLNVQGLQIFQQGARLAGASAETLTTGLGTLGQKLHEAAWGRDIEAIGVFRQLKIAVLDSNNRIRSAIDILPELADKVRGTADAYTRMEIATKTLGPAAAGMMPYLLEGREGIARYNEEIKRYHAVMSPAAIENSLQFAQAQARVGLAMDGLGVSIAEKVLPVLTPMMTDFAKWVADSPGVQKSISGIGDEIKIFGDWVKAIDWEKAGTGASNLGKSLAGVGTALNTVLDVMKWMEAHPTITEAVFGAAVGGRIGGPVGAVIGAVGAIYTGERIRQGSGPPSPTPRGEGVIPPPPTGRQPDGSYYAPIAPRGTTAVPPHDAPSIWQRIGRAIGISSASAAPMPGFAAGTDEQMARAAIAAAGGNAKAQAGLLANMYAESGLRRDRPGPGGDFGWAQWVGSRKAALFAMAKENNLDPYSAQAQAMYLKHELTTNPQYAAMIRRMNNAPDATTAAKISGFTFEQGGGDASLFGGGNFSQAGMDAFHSKGAESIYRRLAASDTPSASAAPMGLPSLPADYVFGRHPHPGKHWFTDKNTGISSWEDNPVPPDPKAPWLQPGYVLPPLTGGDAPPVSVAGADRGGAGDGDSSHQVEVTFANAPTGMRAALQSASGVADFTLRTQHAMGP